MTSNNRMTANRAHCSWTVDEPPYNKCPLGSMDDQRDLWAWLAPSQRSWPKTTTHQWIISQFTNCSLDWALWQQIAITMDLPTAEDYEGQLESAKRWHW